MDNSAVSKSTKSTITGGPGRTINTNMGFCGSKVDALSVDDGVLHNDCFIDVLNIIPHCVFLLISLPILIVWSKSVIGTKKVKTWVHFQVHAIRWVLTLILIFTNILEVAEGLTSDARDPDTVNYHVFIPQCMAAIGTTVSITYYHNVEIWNSPGFLIVLWGYWAAALFLKVLKLISLYNNNLNMEDMRVWLTWIVIILYGILILIEVDVLRLQKYAFFKKSYPVHSPDELIDLKYIHPYVSFISKATFWWITNFLRKGYHHVIELHDLGKLPLREQAVLNFEKLQKTYEEEHLKASEKNQKPSLLRSLLKASWPILALSASFRLGADLLAFVGPWWIESIVDYAYLNQNSPPPTSILGNSTSRKEALTITIQEFLSNGYVITVLVFMMMLIQHTLMQYHFFMVVREGMRMKGALQVMIYNKLLQLSSQAIQNGLVSETEILNYTATDTNHIFIFFSFIHYFWAVPLQILLGFVLVCFKMGPSAAIGAVIIVFHAFVHFVIAGQFTRLQLKYMISSDRRVKKVNGIIHGIKMLKINAWERIFCSQVEKEREKELRDVFSLAGYKTFVELLVTAAPLTSTLMTLVNYYYIEGESVTPGKIFSTIALFQVMNSSLYFLSVMYNCIGNVKVSIRQLEPFLTSTNICCQHTSTLLEDKLPPTIHIEAIHPEDKVDTVIRYDVTSESTSLSLHKENGALHGSQNSLESTLQHTPGHSRQSSGASLLEVLGSKRLSLSQHSSTVTLEGMDFPEHRRRRCFSGVSMEDEEDMAEILRIYETRTILEVNNGNFSWHSTDEPFLKNINLKIPAGKLTMIIGPSGSGKTSLLNAILGEMIQHSGSVNWSRNTSLAYLSQPPWIMNRTIQENILFGQPYSWRRYKRVLHACALHHDLGLMPSGDRTEIGEKGITLNEGQKQRVSLARALYSHADTIILDDAFSCMEPHQSKAVFDDAVVRRFLRRKRTVILTTTQLHNINQASQIIAMKNCTIRCQGKLSEVKKMDAELYESWRKALKEIKKDIDHDQERPRKSSFDHSQPPELVVRQLSVQSQLGVPISRHVSQMSVMTETSQEDEGLEEEESFEQDGRLIKLDNRDIRSVTLSVYKEYFKSCSLTLVVIAILLLVAKHFFLAVTDVWLLHWTSQEMLFLQGRRENATAATNEPVNSLYHLLIYVGLAFVTLLVSGVAGLILKLATLRGARLLHQKLLTSVLCLPIRFFEMTSSVGILNMFTADVRVVDQALPTTLELLLRSGLLGLAVIVVSSIATPYFIVIAVPLLVVFYFLERFYRPTSRQLQRLQNLAKSPLFTHFSEILTGIKTVRAYRAQQWFQRQMMHSVDIYNVVFLYTHAINRWLGVRLDFMGSAVLLLATLTSLTTAIFVDGCPAAVGLCLLYAFMMPSYLNWISRYLSELDMNACSVEKILDYSADTEKKNNGGDVNIEKNWPDKGEIVFSHVALQYDPNQSPVIKDATFTINEGEMVALCGHTGSGRSSLIMALFKMIDLSEGQIIIDNRDIAHVPAAVLCSRLSVVPHDPVLFDGTLRFNLDLENKHNDEALWNALENVHLKDVIQDLPQKLDTPVKESGKNFSITERQLFCLARALLRCPRILIVEQSHVHHRDTLAEEKIQQVIESAFTNTTVISLIHHLTNLKMYDRLMVLQHGRVVEYDTPEALTSNENSMLVNLLRENQFRHPGRGSVIA